ncbi:hypothetical protein D9758_015552 [Tetrapyrgos nigripes]|uniref:Uncharacterized protein n=1 Tax=Tetrapyrgos nigripes TaxID=182062 RepID=A0A8H5C5E4_9AGAR|nr:hypothetical protein D9758_015552 [Tetrapyrgos nigripes]
MILGRHHRKTAKFVTYAFQESTASEPSPASSVSCSHGSQAPTTLFSHDTIYPIYFTSTWDRFVAYSRVIHDGENDSDGPRTPKPSPRRI